MRKILFILALFQFTGYSLFAQQAYIFKEGLISGQCHEYGRTALFTDQLAGLISEGQLKTPINGAPSFTDDKGKANTWQPIKINEDNSFAGRAINNGYLYVSYNSPKDQTLILNITGHQMVYVNGTPHAGDMYRYGWMYIPVALHKGVNDFYIRTGRSYGRMGIKAQLIFPEKPVYISMADSTLPFLVANKNNKELWGAVVIVNTTNQPLKDLQILTTIAGKNHFTAVPLIAAQTSRKVGFVMEATDATANNSNCELSLLNSKKVTVIDRKTFTLKAVSDTLHYSNTFVSDIDGSVQYYSVSPQSHPDGKAPALFLSVHGAEVQAINQASAYKYKDWGVLIAPTNRRPRGFNWEDWGRLDALEVLSIATKEFKPDPERIYLTGHSMGGHGTWYLGATFPGKWAAIAPCSGYPTLMGYGSADGLIPDSPHNNTEKVLLRASNPSNVFKLANNYKASGVYILHGDSDKVVSVDYARQMKQILAGFHADYSYYEYPGGEHWYGDQCVDWGPLFQFFKWHTIPADSSTNVVDFTTANPAISSSYHWTHILQQQHALEYSRLQLFRHNNTITGTTTNVATLAFDVKDIPTGVTTNIILDGKPAITYTRKATDTMIYLHKGAEWAFGTAPPATEKGIARNGTFKEAFKHNMVFVYSTGGQSAENEWSLNKARYDAETWYYRGNGAVDIIADKDFDAVKYADCGVIIYGNASTNKAWKKLLSGSPVQITRGKVTVGTQEYTGDHLAAYFTWPRADSKTASVAVIGGTGLAGMRAADANQYFAGGSGFPDYMIFSTDLLKGDVNAVKTAGFYDNEWKLDNAERIQN